jgi:iron complex outermembrane recepter protein
VDKNFWRVKRRLVFPVIAASIVISGHSWAAETRVIEEVLVTANKRLESSQDVPLSISVVNGDFVRESGITDVGEITRYIPNVNFDASLALYTTVTIRGFGTPPLGVGFEPSIGLVIDDVPFGRSTFTQDAVFDLERLEVLRGSQGTLFGKNTLGGVFNFHTAAPTDSPEGYISYNRVEDVTTESVELAVSGPLIGDNLLGRIAYRYSDGDTLEYNSTRDEQQTQRDEGLRVKLLWDISDTLTGKVNLLRAESVTKGYTQSLFIASERSLRVFREYDPETETDPYDQNTSTDGLTLSDRETAAASLQLLWQTPTFLGLQNTQLTSILAWSQVKTPYALDVDYSPVNLVVFNGPPRGNPYSARSVEFRFDATAPSFFGLGNEVDFVVGLFGQRSKVNVFQDIDVDLNGLIAFARAGAIVQNQQLPFDPVLVGLPVDTSGLIIAGERERFISGTSAETVSYAVFSQLNWAATERLSVTLGLRYGEDESTGRSFSAVAEGNSFSAGSLQQESFNAPDLERSESNVSPKLALNYEVLPDINVYATAVKGFKAGGFDFAPLNPNSLEYGAESAVTYEVGLKSRLLGGSLVLNMAAFDSEVEDLQIRTFNGVTLVTDNAPESESRGAELDFFWLPPLQGLSIAGSVGYLDAIYKEFPDGPPIFTSGQDDGQDLAGKPLPYASEWNATLSPRYEFAFLGVDSLRASVRLNVSYNNGRFLDSDIDPNTYQEGTTRIDAGIGLRSETAGWSINFNAKNLTREKDALLILDQPLLPGNYTMTPYPDQTIYQLGLRWDMGR